MKSPRSPTEELNRCSGAFIGALKGARGVERREDEDPKTFIEENMYTVASLKSLFGLPGNVKSNFSRKEELFKMFCTENNELHRCLVPLYFKSGDNGMPWGKWDPQYQAVRVVKVKA